MLITDKKLLQEFSNKNRLWQGVPGIEVTKNGRMFITFYSGGIAEQIGNYVLLYSSDNEMDFSLIAVAYPEEGHRCFDSCLWIDPLGRLWFTWSYAPDNSVCAVICDNPDSDILVWGKERRIGGEVMMNKPTVLSTGEWLFPIAVWNNGINAGGISNKSDREVGSYAYKSTDQGKTIVPYGCADVPNRSYDEHMILELKNGVLMMLVRTNYGIGVSYSYDSGKIWTKGIDSTLGGPCSRFCIRRLKSGRIILINHFDFKGRNNLTALLSEDDGKTFPYKLLLDERNDVSYPDLKEADNGFIYVVYDRERGAFNKNLESTMKAAREILFAKITENDILKGEISKESKLKSIANKLGKYTGKIENPFHEISKLSNYQLAEELITKKENAIDSLFDLCPVNCINSKNINYNKMDALIEEFIKSDYTDIVILERIVKIVRSSPDNPENKPIIDKVIKYVDKHFTEDFTINEIAQLYNCSIYYLCHEFKKHMGISVVSYRNKLRLLKAKKLLINSDESISNIANICGYSSESYFGRIFMREESLTPGQYRNVMNNN